MGCRFAPTYAGIFQDRFEQQHLSNTLVQPIVCKRYIDDIFAVIDCSVSQLE